MVKLTAIQLSSAANVATNLAKIAELLAKITTAPIGAKNGSTNIGKHDDTVNERIQHLVVLPNLLLIPFWF